ncbi:MAG: hypothetical protein IRZ14_04525 [Chloroflexi bacterium]|nr:hypothetical protein [Chloroflexota bacterium]
MDRLPVLGLDLDGVLVQPPLGWNVAISRRLALPRLPAEVPRLRLDTRWRQNYWLARTGLEIARYAGRRPLPGVAEALAALATVRQLEVVSGRRWVVRPLVRRWLERHGLAPYIAAVHLNDRPLASAQFKLWLLMTRGIAEHVDDDGATAYYLARHGVDAVYLCDWPRNRGLPYPPSVRRVRDLRDLASLLADPLSAGARTDDSSARSGE